MMDFSSIGAPAAQELRECEHEFHSRPHYGDATGQSFQLVNRWSFECI
jgi:hypothetical protein